jgi:hypothetical protein
MPTVIGQIAENPYPSEVLGPGAFVDEGEVQTGNLSVVFQVAADLFGEFTLFRNDPGIEVFGRFDSPVPSHAGFRTAVG